MAKITVICRNEDCTMFNQPQEVEKSEMVCPECGEPVIPFDGGKKPNWFEENKKLVGLIAAALILLGGGGFGIFKACSSGDKTGPVKPEPVSVQVDSLKKDTVKVDTSKVDKPEVKQEEETKKELETVEPKTTTSSVFGGRAKYDKAAGVITFTGTVTISLHDEDDNTLTFRRGDKIRGAKVSGGRLVGGEAVIGGESQLLSGISERM